MSDVQIDISTSQAQQAVASLDREFTKLSERTDKLTQLLGKQYLATESLTKSYAQMTSNTAGMSSQIGGLTSAIATESAVVKNLLTGILNTNQAMVANSVAVSKSTQEIVKQTSATKVLTAAHEKLHFVARGASGALGSLWMSYGSQLMPMLTAFAATAAAVKTFSAGTNFEFMNTFSSSLSEGAVSVGKLNEQLLQMKGLAQTPNELANIFLELTKAGYSASKALTQGGALETVSKYSFVGQMDPKEAAKQLVTLTNAFVDTSVGLREAKLSIADTADIVAYAAQKSVADFKDMGTAFKYMTATASTSSFSLQEVAAALMVVHDKGLAGSLGATGLRTAFERLKNPTEKASAMFKALGGNMDAIYSDGKFRGIQSIGAELKRLKDTADAADWSEFSFDMFGQRGMNVNALIDSMAQLDKYLLGIGQSAGFVDKVFSDLSQTTKYMLKEVEASFERAFIKAFDGEKAREVLTDINNILASPGFAASLTDIATGTYELSKGLAAVVNQFFRLPTTVMEAGIVGAILFGVKGKLALAGLIAAADVISRMAVDLNNLKWLTEEKDAAKLFDVYNVEQYRKNTQQFGKEYAVIQDKILFNEGQIAAMRAQSGDKADVAGYEQELAYQKVQLENYQISVKQHGLDKVASQESIEANSAIEQARVQNIESLKGIGEQTVKNGRVTKAVTTSEQAEINRLQQMYEFYGSYVQNLDNDTTASKLANIEKKYTADRQYLEQHGKDSRDAQVALTQLEMWRASEVEKINRQLEEKKQVIRKKATDAYENDLVYLENLDNETLAGKLARIDKELQTKISAIEAAKQAGMNELDAEKAKTAAMEVETHKRGLLYKKQEADRKEFYDGIKSFRQELSGGSELEDFISGGDSKIDKLFDSFKKGASARDIAAATEEVSKLKDELRQSDKAAILGDNPFKGFMAGVREAQRETATLGKLGAEVGKEFQNALADSFKELFFGKNKNHYTDQITTISEKIKEMQYGALKDGASQLEFLRQEYDASLTGAMKGNKDMFESYMSNLDTYLDKAKEEMSPEEYERVYAQTMSDLDRLNNEYAGKTEDVWDRLGDVWDDFTGRIVDKWMDAVANIAANEIIFQITGKSTMSGALSGIFGGSGGSGGGGGSIVGGLAEGAWDYVSDWWNSSGSSWTNDAGTWVDEIASWSGYGPDNWYADGGYIGGHPKGGVIRGGSGVSDDVFLGYTDGGATANYGMGGEFIINKKATAKYLPVLEQINSQGYASGGQYGSKDEVITKFNQLGDAMLASGVSASDVRSTLIRMMREFRKNNEELALSTELASNGISAMAEATTASTSAINAETNAKTNATIGAAAFTQALGTVTGVAFGPAAAAAAKAFGAAITSDKAKTTAESITDVLGAITSFGLTSLGPLGALVGLVGQVTGVTGTLKSGLLGLLNSAFGTTTGESTIAGDLSESMTAAINDSFASMADSFSAMTNAESFAEAEAAIDSAVAAMATFSEAGLPGVLGQVSDSAVSLGDVSAALGETASETTTAISDTATTVGSYSATMMGEISAVLGDMQQSATALQGAVAEAQSAAEAVASAAHAAASAASSIGDSYGGSYGEMSGATEGNAASLTGESTDPGGYYGGEGGTSSSSGGTTGSVGSDGLGHNGESGEASGWATGGWLAKHRSGMINQGSHARDDVFLGYTNGGLTANWGMGGEYVVNQRSTAKHLPELIAINNDTFAGGGVTGTGDLFKDSPVVGEPTDLNDPEIKAVLVAIATYVKKSARILQRFEYTGIPTAVTQARG